MSDYEFRFGGVGRLFGATALERLRRAHVCVVGIGGVGSWAVEALARSGVGRLTLIDLDEICISNVNRQLHALDPAVGQPKVAAMAERVRGINAECEVQAVTEFFTTENAAQLLEADFDFVIDAIDNVANKARLIAACREKRLPVVASGGAGGRRDATQIRTADLALTTHDRLLQKVRDTLRKEFGFPRGAVPFGVECVYSPEPPIFARCDGSVSAEREPGTELRLNCESGLGTATFVTGTFGFIAAGVVVQKLCGQASPVSVAPLSNVAK